MSVTDIHEIRASAVPSVPKTISASQRLAALNQAHNCQDTAEVATDILAKRVLERAARLLIELASDAKAPK